MWLDFFIIFYLDDIKNKMPSKYIFMGRGFLVADLWNGLQILFQNRKQTIVDFVNVILACQIWGSRHYISSGLKRSMRKG